MAKVFRITVTQTIEREVRIQALDSATALDPYFEGDFNEKVTSDIIVEETNLKIDGVLVEPSIPRA